MYYSRNIDSELENWKQLSSRKPLILRGARQVGKSSAVRNLASLFVHYVEINFDEDNTIHKLFDNNQTPEEICQQLSLLTNTPIIEGKTLLFLDEIQACIPAIASLRYFYEKLPNLHVIAAGSLLEFVLAELPSFGVGRVRSLFVYPFSFSEFLTAQGEDRLRKLISEASAQTPIPDIIHAKLTKILKTFLIVGGMPEAVNSFIENGDLIEVQRVLNDLIISIQDDFSKYKNSVPTARVREVFDAIAQQTGTKFTYTYPNSTLNNKQIKEALSLLTMAGLVYPVIHSDSNGIPLGAQINPKKRKFLFLDCGLLQRILGLQPTDILLEETLKNINKGNIAELFVGLELLKTASPYEKQSLYYWHREAKNSQAEVDYVIQIGKQIVPIEVKSGTKGGMKSMRIFLDEKNVDLGIRISLENYTAYDNIMTMPLYGLPVSISSL